MNGVFRHGESVLILSGPRSFLIRLEGDMARIEGGRGAVSTSSIVGLRPGSRIRIGSREMVVIRPDALDFIEHLKRGAQIITPKDSSAITAYLGIADGKTVIEGGAGSGGLTIALLNAVKPTGRVITYEIRQDHLARTSSNVETAGLSEQWEGRIGDIRQLDLENEADGFVIDIPDGEKAVKCASRALKPGGRFVSYVPTVNQMERIVAMLRSEDFSFISAEEIIRREYSVREGAVRPDTEMLGHTGFIIRARWIG
ncbi:MAG: tRNA (adenine-N1)-methyltransferase [Thermoplasmatota archaeon]